MTFRQKLGGAGGLWVLLTAQAMADGYFLQADVGGRNQTAVATASRDALSYGLSISDYDGGRSGAVSLTYALPPVRGAVVKLGPTVGLRRTDDDSGTDVTPGVKATVERYTPTSFGATYLLADVSSVHRSWFVLGQVSFAPANIGLELSRGGSDDYRETTLAMQKRLSDTPFSLRLGYKLSSDELFAGFSVNTF
ncbi:MAG: hypothetical protein ACK4YU_03620 [Paracoccus sp. (in: a-proteobacteria)]